ncbi:hypothetical protein ACFO5R_06135 [Halosolutus amylolyticus]|uniref:Uncharacterized protein n=1 Tax=Halosolutus amylolyticus TaxID=2932267 RepID=A0ABD5PLN4_9EURY|nr:hypothetical protein [Halosolutus amylolyticus]
MDWEAPADAWYVFLAVSIVSAALAGVVLSLPTGPPPDATQAANTIERVSGSSTEASATWKYEADTIRIDGPTIELENEHGTDRASTAYGVVVPVNETDRLINITHGAEFEDEYETELDDGDTHAFETFLSDLEDEYQKNSGEPMVASGELVVRQISIDPNVDEVENEHESAELEVTETSRFGNIREVTLSYDGIDGRSIELELEGSYTTGTDLHYEKSRTFSTGSGSIVISDISSPKANFAGDPPLDFSVEYEDGSWGGTGLNVGTTLTWDNEVERSADLDDDAPFVEYRDSTGEYHVTIVTV